MILDLREIRRLRRDNCTRRHTRRGRPRPRDSRGTLKRLSWRQSGIHVAKVRVPGSVHGRGIATPVLVHLLDVHARRGRHEGLGFRGRCRRLRDAQTARRRGEGTQ